MTTDDLADVLKVFHREKLVLRQRHVAVARRVTDYAFNNTYQYVIAREDVHLHWLESALAELGATPDEVPEPALPATAKGDGFVPLVVEDARESDAFVARWRDAVAGLSHARHRRMLGVVLGEAQEHHRFFTQIAAGRQDVLGRRANGPGSSGTAGSVLPVRWLE